MLTRFSNRDLEPILEAYGDVVSKTSPARRIIAYRGDGSDMSGRIGPRSDTHGTGMWFTSSELVATTYGNVGKYALSLERPFVFDAEGSFWNDIEFEPLTKGKSPTVTMPVHRYNFYHIYDGKFVSTHMLKYENLPLEEAEKMCDRYGDWDYAMRSIPYTSVKKDAYGWLSKEDRKVLSEEDSYERKEKVFSIIEKLPDSLVERGTMRDYYHFGFHDIKWPGATVNDLARYVRSLGRYDGLIIKNVVDGGSDAHGLSDVSSRPVDLYEDVLLQTDYVVFDESKVERVG